MVSIGRISLCLGALASLIWATSAASAGEKDESPESVVIGMPDSLFQGIPAFLKKAGAKPFLKLMKDSTGIDGQISFERVRSIVGFITWTSWLGVKLQSIDRRGAIIRIVAHDSLHGPGKLT